MERGLDPVAKALWFIESHLGGEVTLADIAEAAGVSRFHMARAFGDATGVPVMRYVRGRRLSVAARVLADGAPNILMVALDAGYGSHEAFTRAFRDQFGVTPEAVRVLGTVRGLSLMEVCTMDETAKVAPRAPRMVDGPALLIAGLGERFTFDTLGGLPGRWQRFRPVMDHVPGRVGVVKYGICHDTDDSGFDYIAGVEVRDFAALPAEYARLRVAAQRYATFTHEGHVSAVRRTFTAIFNDWFPRSGVKPADAPVFERYDERFDPETGMGGFEIWVPVGG